LTVRSREVKVLNSGRTRQVRKVRLGDHLCLPFSSDDEQREVLTTYILDGLARGERIIYYAGHTAPDKIGAWLAATGVDTGRIVEEGRLDIRRFEPDMVITRLWVEVRQTRDAGYPGLRISSEMTSDVQPVGDRHALIEYENRLAEVFDSGEVAAICQYDRRLFDRAAVAGVIDCHPRVVQIDPLHDDHRLRITPMFDPRGLRIAGAVDLTTSGALTSTLRLATNWPEPDLHIDLGELEFIDVAGVRALVQAAARLGPGRRLTVERLAPRLRRVFGLVGWDRAPGLRFAEEVDQ
jgi:anti-anti-sigma regulatory factor